MNDLISRQAAIDALDDIESEVADGFGFQYEKWRKHFADLPSAQPTAEPVQHGKWIKADSQQYFRKHYPAFTCSECGQRKDSQKTWNYCPNCGARMDKDE